MSALRVSLELRGRPQAVCRLRLPRGGIWRGGKLSAARLRRLFKIDQGHYPNCVEPEDLVAKVIDQVNGARSEIDASARCRRIQVGINEPTIDQRRAVVHCQLRSSSSGPRLGGAGQTLLRWRLAPGLELLAEPGRIESLTDDEADALGCALASLLRRERDESERRPACFPD